MRFHDILAAIYNYKTIILHFFTFFADKIMAMFLGVKKRHSVDDIDNLLRAVKALTNNKSHFLLSFAHLRLPCLFQSKTYTRCDRTISIYGVILYFPRIQTIGIEYQFILKLISKTRTSVWTTVFCLQLLVERLFQWTT